jgi:hypothetical protein
MPSTHHRKKRRQRHRLRFLAAVLSVASICQSGCIRKRMTIRTSPPGAMAYIDKQPIGLTPVSTSFTYYGTRNFELVRDNYRTERFLRKINPPWYAIPPLDFFSETLWPFEKRDERVIDVQLNPEPVVSREGLVESGEQLRLQAGQGLGVSAPPTMTIPPPIVNQPNTNTAQPAIPILGPASAPFTSQQ